MNADNKIAENTEMSQISGRIRLQYPDVISKCLNLFSTLCTSVLYSFTYTKWRTRESTYIRSIIVRRCVISPANWGSWKICWRNFPLYFAIELTIQTACRCMVYRLATFVNFTLCKALRNTHHCQCFQLMIQQLRIFGNNAEIWFSFTWKS